MYDHWITTVNTTQNEKCQKTIKKVLNISECQRHGNIHKNIAMTSLISILLEYDNEGKHPRGYI